MKSILIGIALFSINLNFCFGQILPSAAVPSQLNSLGDPITNILDPNGAKQGEWFYQDIFGTIILKEVYQDHKLIQIEYPVLNSDNSVKKWVNRDQFETDSIVLSELESQIKATGVYSKEFAEKQLVVILLANGDINVFPIGKWELQEAKDIVRDLIEKLEQLNLSVKKDAFIII